MPPVQTGVLFSNVVVADRHLTNQILLNGSGVACGDVDGDGWTDVYFCALDQANRLFRNLGSWRFEDFTATAGVACSNLLSTGTLLADLDGDGDLDLLVSTLGQGVHVFFNDGHGHFTASPQSGRLNGRRGALSMALSDVDGDGDLDLYVANYRTATLRDEPNTRFDLGITNGQPFIKSINGRPFDGPDLTNRFTFTITLGAGRGSVRIEENGEPDELFLNDGRGQFEPVSWTDGRFRDAQGRPLTQPPLQWSQSVLIRDFNGDGLPDIYVCGDFVSPDGIWWGDGRGNFKAAHPLQIRQTPLASMGVDVADLNRDGVDDVFVLDMLSRNHTLRHSQRALSPTEPSLPGVITNTMQYPRNILLLGLGGGAFVEIAQYAGLDATDWAWTPAFLDVDLDGWEDLLVANGFERDNMDVDSLRKLELARKERPMSAVEQLRLRALFPRLPNANCAFRNLGTMQFADVSEQWGFATRSVSQGMALADLDNDGDLDVVLNNFNEPAALYRNNAPASRVAVRLRGRSPNTQGIGARISVEAAGLPVQAQEMVAGGRYLSCDAFMRVFAAGAAERLNVTVRWRDGTETRWTNAPANAILEVEQSAAQPVPKPLPPKPAPLFKDVSDLLSHKHYDEGFDDFAQHPWLTHKLSQLGPGVAWCDANGDGWEEPVVGAGRGGCLAFFLNKTNGGFHYWDSELTHHIQLWDLLGLVVYPQTNLGIVLLAAASPFELGETNRGYFQNIVLSSPKHGFEGPTPHFPHSPGPLALADLDGDGNLELFVGGRVVPGAFGLPADSHLCVLSNGLWTLDPRHRDTFKGVGMVSGAVFSDVDGDGDADLLLACTWGPVRLFKNDGGKLRDATREAGLDAYTGWWNGITTGDFNNDGRMDIVASNWGRNTRFEHRRQKPLQLFVGDFDKNGTTDAIEAYTEPHQQRLVPAHPYSVAIKGMPVLAARFDSCRAYAQATLADIYGNALQSATVLSARWLETTVFINEGGSFRAVPLPDAAQFSPAFGVCVADFDGDGNEDIFLSQNFFATHVEISRYDAGSGLLVLGDGRGGFRPLTRQESGLEIFGEQRGAAVCDYDRDGRVDLLVAQHCAETRLFRNVRGRPGLRVRLTGLGGNPAGVGSVLRLGNGREWGPARELHAGSGYLSQDSLIPVMYGPAPADRLQVRWPGGQSREYAVPPEALEIEVFPDGSVRKIL